LRGARNEKEVVVYSEAFKRKMIQRMMGPNGRTATALSQEVNIHQSTLSRWMREASRVADVSSPKSSPPPPPTVIRSAEEKLRLVLAAAQCSEEERGALLRREGVHEAELARWREVMAAALQDEGAADKSKKGGASKRVRQLERELRRKDKALAEAAALLVLQKKVQAIWGDEDDDTTETSED